MKAPLLRRVTPSCIPQRSGGAVDPTTAEQAARIVDEVRDGGETALRRYAERLDGLSPGKPLIYRHTELETAREEVSNNVRSLLQRTADRIRRFADAQRACLTDLRFDIPGGSAGHTIEPLEVAGCYAPGGRYPLVSSVLMTAVTARAAGVDRVWVVTPRPSNIMLAAAAVAGADAVLAVGGAQAIAALAYGVGPAPACDVIVGPGNRWVTAAKQLVSADVRIDLLAGPSELVVLADASADASLIAADLLAQAEHDVDARAILVTTSEPLIEAVQRELVDQLETLPTRETASAALADSYAVSADSVDQAVAVCREMAPEHLELHLKQADQVAERVGRYGALFIGPRSAEVFGDYGAGPNHTLPTGGTARFASGLSVMTFLRMQTWLRLDNSAAAEALGADAADLARLEGLEAHARSAELRSHSVAKDNATRAPRSAG
ncbi:MAG: histidinol dehydrogenase [bacterium]|nr:histidinol dehydrogenase [bacterium]